MPFYEYECASCGHQTEVLQKISDAPLKKCPDCGKQALKRLISAPVFRLAGGGWYETDFKSDKENKRNLAGREESGGEAKTETKSESAKSDAGTESKASSSSPAPAEKTTSKKSVSVSKKPTAKKAPATKPKKKRATGR